MEKEEQKETIQTLSLLYELALDTGRSLDLKTNCDRMLKALMSRKNLKYAGLWIHQTKLLSTASQPTQEHPQNDAYNLVYSSPKFWTGLKTVDSQHPLITLLTPNRPFCVVDSEKTPELFDHLITEKRLKTGVFIIYRLGNIGILKLYAAQMSPNLVEAEMAKLLSIVDSFTRSIEGCIAHHNAIAENQQRQKTETALKAVEQLLSKQLEELSRKHQTLEITQQTLERRNRRLATTLKELKKTQTQLIQTEKMSSLGHLVAGIAHEINNPISFIHSNLPHLANYTDDLIQLIELYQKIYPGKQQELDRLMEDIELDYLLDDLPKLLNSMAVGSKRIKKIVLSLNNFSRLGETDFKCANLNQGLDSTLLLISHRLKPTHYRPEIQLSKQYETIPDITCLPEQLNQVFMNLLVNAIDAIDEQHKQQSESLPAPCITLHTRQVNESHVQVDITDNGPGILAEMQRQLFDPFFTTKPVGKGTGLGLSISYQIVTDTHKGRLQCLSEVGQGTTFQIVLPIRQQWKTAVESGDAIASI
ncbi:sensor histidine kinase [Leptothoe kymatousa]|uniref:histidine kinase n=1 Tax=Leptothoe kymatousa TAU-MAC 1615 TaxID=2364775 RepID=A0ABS5Y2D3_9CYAN|nr:ATP-binding protein [Leptothoe kymatousa]MBT9311776.1 hypothetical protein [Leptothoe kymatousa TAU-MAC 1615]